jgi:ornithine cyclodeaminase
MRFFDSAAVDAALGYPHLIDILEAAFVKGAIAPPRHHHAIALHGRPEATLLLMPAWESAQAGGEFAGRFMGVKTVTVFPDNGERGKPAVLGTYVLLSAETGEALAIMDATRLTAWRTAAASGLASRKLSRPDATRLLMVGAGALAPFLVRAHSSVRPIRDIALWNRSRPRAEALAATLAQHGMKAIIVDNLADAAANADIISTATLSPEPLIRGAWLKPGTHLDCVGAYRPGMRETDDEVVRRARMPFWPTCSIWPAARFLDVERRTRLRCSSRWALRSRIWPLQSRCTRTPVRSMLRFYRGRSLRPVRKRSMAWAACRPSRIAHTTRDWPRRISPAANTFLWVLRR